MSEELIGRMIEIIEMEGEPQYSGAVGEVTSVDDMGQIHGTWGGCALIPETDIFRVIEAPHERSDGYGRTE